MCPDQKTKNSQLCPLGWSGVGAAKSVQSDSLEFDDSKDSSSSELRYGLNEMLSPMGDKKRLELQNRVYWAQLMISMHSPFRAFEDSRKCAERRTL